VAGGTRGDIVTRNPISISEVSNTVIKTLPSADSHCESSMSNPRHEVLEPPSAPAPWQSRRKASTGAKGRSLIGEMDLNV
jgi:hypothetical protein